MSAQGSRNENPGYANNKMYSTLKGFANCLTLSGFGRDFKICPRVLATLEPWAEISERLRRFIQFKLMHYLSRTPVKNLLLTLSAVFLFQSICAAQSSPAKTVLDYYLLLPEKYFEANKEQRVKWMLDPGRGAVVDIKNGYIYAPGDGAQTPIYVCLFNRPHGLPLVAVKSHPSDTNEYTHLDFYEYKHGTLVEVKNGVLPVKVNENFKYEMPRYGRSIKVSDQRGKRIYSLNWSGRRFVLKP
jgi:hypothetical protein